jgi:hypothetical protein
MRKSSAQVQLPGEILTVSIVVDSERLSPPLRPTHAGVASALARHCSAWVGGEIAFSIDDTSGSRRRFDV